VDFGDAGEGGGDGGAEGSEDLRVEDVECGEEVGFGAAFFFGEVGEGDGEGAGGEVGLGVESVGDGEDDGAAEVLEKEVAGDGGGGGFADGDAGALGEAAEGVGELRGEFGYVVEGEDPVLAGEGEEVAGVVREGEEDGVRRARTSGWSLPGAALRYRRPAARSQPRRERS